ncbi:hypothetical protein BH11MYX4_BH11MYX4_02990 [soil metagenome]
MTARFVPIGEPAHDAERQALRFLVDNLPDDYIVYGNPWLVERSGAVFELDAVVVAAHAIYVVEIKSYRGSINGNDNDWYVPQPIRSPLKLNRKTAQVIASLLKQRSVDAARPFVEGLVFLSHANDCRVVGPASAERIHTRRTILTALQDPTALWRREGRRPPVDEHATRTVHELLTGADASHKPPRLVREWKLEAAVERTDRFVEYFATHRITGEHAVLRVYDAPMLEEEATRRRVEDLFRWEAQVLRRIGEHPHVLHAEAPFVDEAGFVLPFEPFSGITLGSWIERYSSKLSGSPGIRAKVDLWKAIADAIDAAHRQGVVHRLLRPEVVLVEDILEKPDIRIAGFELAKQLYLPGQTVAVSSLSDDRRRWAAPEVVRSFSDADARSDQFSLGAMLAHMLIGRPAFDSTEEMIRRNGAYTRLRDVSTTFKQSLDQALATMLSVAAANRFPSLSAAVEAVELAVSGRAPTALPTVLDPENLPDGTRLGTDYEVTGKLGAGGMATVYVARHLVSGSSRALKVSRPDARAEDALRGEYQALQGVDHPNIVRAIDITSVVPERKTLVLERVKGTSLAARFAAGALHDEERRLYAEHLLAALGYLEQKGIVHKDIKPDNLIVSTEGLTVIDFSLAGEAPEATTIGTALYRDPALERWSALSDRYAAALCLFEMYVGRHAFGGQTPSPGDRPLLDAQEVDRVALYEFFLRALSPTPRERHPSALAMRSALLEALGSKAVTSVPPPSPAAGLRAGDAPLSATALSGTSLSCLRRAGITTQGALVGLDDAKISALPGLGTKKREEVLALRQSLIESGVERADDRGGDRHPLYPELIGEESDVHALGLPGTLADTLARAGFATVGRLADATRHDLLKLQGVGPKVVAQVVQGLQRFGESARGVDVPTTLDGLWELATRPLQGQQITVVERLFGIRGGRPVLQQELADEIGLSQPSVSLLKQRAVDVIDRRVLDEVIEHVEGLLVVAGGLLRIDEVGARLLERWPVSSDFAELGFLRLLAELVPTRFACLAVLDEEPGEVLARPTFDDKSIVAFLQAARTLASWPPKKADGVRQSLQSYLPEYPLDPVGLATRLSRDLRLTDDGELFEAPVSIKDATLYVLRKSRLPVKLEDLRELLLSHFGAAVSPPPELSELTVVVAKLGTYQLDAGTGTVDVPATRSIETKSELAADPLPFELRAQDPTELACRVIRSLAERDGFRLVVASPEQHPEIARSLVPCLGTDTLYVSFEDELFRRIDADIDAFERAERFLAQRAKLKREAEALLDSLVKEKGRAGARIVLGDTALWAVCDSLHLVRRLYDLTSTGGRGFWVLVVPGLVHQTQPLFNEKPGAIVFSMGGTVLPLTKPVPASLAI